MVTMSAKIMSMMAVALLSVVSSVRCLPGPPLYTLCNDEINTDLNYVHNVKYVLINVTTETPYSGFNYYAESPLSGTTAFAHGVCNGEISESGCQVCMNYASKNLLDICNGHIGGQIQLQECRARYEAYSFSE